MDLREVLAAELERRCARNSRYSLRAYALWLGIHHATLSQILNRRRRLTPRTIRKLGKRLGVSASDIQAACVEENSARVLEFVGTAKFRADSRWIATMTGIAIDDVNASLHWLLHTRRVVMLTPTTWIAGDAQ